MRVFAVIMAGGIGSRFWPRSREKTPKQLLKIFDDRTIIQSTVDRISTLVPSNDIFIVTSAAQVGLMAEQLPDIPSSNLIVEPFGRNTAACIGLASIILKNIDPEAVTVVLPADHLIQDVDLFIGNLRTAIDFAYQKKVLLTIGIPPTRPETGYGYVQIEEKLASANVYPVHSFAEKPNYTTALRFLESGDFLWNSGMFIWRTDVVLEEISIYMPELHFSLLKIAAHLGKPSFVETLTEVYAQIKSISIDYGLMEKSKRVYLVKSQFRWSDVGSWEEVYQLGAKDEQGNVLNGDCFTDATLDSYVYSPEKFVALIGVDNLVVINTEDSLLICRRDHAQDVKKVVDHLKRHGMDELL